MNRFTLTADHVKLIQRMHVYWEDGAYDGAPSIDIKRPYGNSSVWQDVANIIGIQQVEDDDGEHHYPKGTRDKCIALHQSTATALQICLSAQSFDPGDYVRGEYSYKWSRSE